MTINPTADGPEPMPQGPHMKEATDADDGLEKQLDIARQVSDVSTAATQSPAGVSPWAPPCEPVPFHQLESMDEAGNSEQLSEEEQDCSEPARICLGMPPLQSELGQWAQWAVAAEEWQSAVLGEAVEYPCDAEGSDLSSSDEE